MSYNEPERKAGFTDEEFELYGDAVRMNWRDWVALRKHIQGKRDHVLDGRKLLYLPFHELDYVGGLDWVIRKMDEMLR